MFMLKPHLETEDCPSMITTMTGWKEDLNPPFGGSPLRDIFREYGPMLSVCKGGIRSADPGERIAGQQVDVDSAFKLDA